MASEQLDPAIRAEYARQSAVNFAIAAWKVELEKSLDLLFSPYSLYRALAVLTVEVLPAFRDAFLATLRFPVSTLSINDFAAAVGDIAANLESHHDFILRDVNNVWINAASNISEARFSKSHEHLSVNVSTVTFPNPAIAVINRYIAQATDGMIPAAFTNDSLDADTAFLVTNALYLHGQWYEKFDSAHTRLEPFTCFDGSKITTQIMRGALKVSYAVNDFAQLVFLPYERSSCEFVAILPLKETEASFREALSSLDPSWFASSETAKVHLRLPKFRMMGSTLSFNTLAKELGLRDVFETDQQIFPELEGEPRLVMGDIKQQVVIDVDEAGTTAASITWHMAGKSRPPPVVQVDLDRPFAYLIRDHVTGTILIMGTYLDPTGHESSA
jgi:serpin B